MDDGLVAKRPFAERLRDIYTGSMLTNMLHIGYETGLFEAAAEGPATCQELAERTNLTERYVREWLGAMVTAEIFDYRPEAGIFSLPEEHAAFLTGGSARNLAPVSRILNHFGKHVPGVIESFRHGGGVPYSEYWPEFTCFSSDVWRRIYDNHLVDDFLGRVEGLHDRLNAGADVLDIGSGDGHAINVMARAFPKSRFVGYDLSEAGVAAGNAAAEEEGLANARFEMMDVTRLPTEPKWDVITAFDSIHDQFEPQRVLDNIRGALKDDGYFLMIDFKFRSAIEDNIGNPFAPMHYGISILHCMTVSLAGGGAGLGTVWGIDKATEMVKAAGFNQVEVLDSPRPQNCIYICCP
ncbi:MAG: hypothetical protein CMM50_12750 [Rhodospirillaceae bacterium]|nr:hypothetical protein [Rhodospirillaceae bacterium]